MSRWTVLVVATAVVVASCGPGVGAGGTVDSAAEPILVPEPIPAPAPSPEVRSDDTASGASIDTTAPATGSEEDPATDTAGRDSAVEDELFLRMCGESQLASPRACPQEQPASFNESVVWCTFTVDATTGEDIVGVLTWNGLLLAEEILLEDAAHSGSINAFMNFTVDPHVMPGGTYGCRIAVGEGLAERGLAGDVDNRSAAGSISGAGPAGAVVDFRVCPGSDAVTFQSETYRVCRNDHSDTPLAPTDEVICSAVVSGVAGGQFRLDVEIDGETAGGTDVETEAAVNVAGLWISTPGMPLPSSDYKCIVSADGARLGELAFSIEG